MSLKYVCRHCGTLLGQIASKHVNETLFGFQLLTPEERGDIISYDLNGDLTASVICDYCKEALDNHPELSLVNSPLQ